MWPWIEETICNNHGQNNSPDFCKTYEKNECSQGEKEFSLKIETNEIGNDCEWGIYNHESEKLVVRQGEEDWSHSTYYSEMCIRRCLSYSVSVWKLYNRLIRHLKPLLMTVLCQTTLMRTP